MDFKRRRSTRPLYALQNVANVSNSSAINQIRENMGIAGLVNLSFLYSCSCMAAISETARKNMIEVAKW